MAKQILLGIVGVVVGVVLGMIVMMGLHMSTSVIYPPPDDVSFMDDSPENQGRLLDWIKTLPAPAFLLASICHGLGCMVGAMIAMIIAGRHSLIPGLVVGVLFTACGVMNLQTLPHPPWFPFVDLPIYLALAFAGGRLLLRKSEQEPDK